MLQLNRPSFIGFLVLLLLTPNNVEAADNKQNFSFAGFGQVVAGQLDTNSATYHGYDNSISFDQESLIGIQADYTVNDYISASGQAVAYTNEFKDSGLEWLFLNITPSKRWQVKIGRHKTPFFNYSDSVDVGFTYPWVTLPQQLYNYYIFRSFEGAFVRYDFPSKSIALNFEAYWGNFDDDYYIAEEQVDVNVNDLSGLITNIAISDFSFRFSYHQGDANVSLQRLTDFSDLLRQSGFVRSADSLQIDGQLEFYQASASYETPLLFVRSEWTRIAPNFLIVPDLRAYYISAGFYQYPFTYHVTYSSSEAKFGNPVEEIPVGLDPQIDALYFGYQTVFDSLLQDDLDSVSVGVRWDIKPNVAIKADLTFLDGESAKRSFFTISEPDFDRSATLMQLGITWVF